ncbi:hypothetical protein ANCCAN_00914 [Ancylostoma caninum]|uniref:Uncharacterized protein n=1 Tax=Ancylostoma caninum TaxID=29170 RepID=A0A368HBC8_ANCCA|nr:hypothetical protein ANCCAN_00914 [Ancylostoma caninum]
MENINCCRHILTAILLAIVIGNFELLLKIVAIFPILLTICFYIFKNNNVKGKNKDKFFAGLHLGGHRGSPHEAPENSIEGFIKVIYSPLAALPLSI